MAAKEEIVKVIKVVTEGTQKARQELSELAEFGRQGAGAGRGAVNAAGRGVAGRVGATVFGRDGTAAMGNVMSEMKNLAGPKGIKGFMAKTAFAGGAMVQMGVMAAGAALILANVTRAIGGVSRGLGSGVDMALKASDMNRTMSGGSFSGTMAARNQFAGFRARGVGLGFGQEETMGRMQSLERGGGRNAVGFTGTSLELERRFGLSGDVAQGAGRLSRIGSSNKDLERTFVTALNKSSMNVGQQEMINSVVSLSENVASGRARLGEGASSRLTNLLLNTESAFGGGQRGAQQLSNMHKSIQGGGQTEFGRAQMLDMTMKRVGGGGGGGGFGTFFKAIKEMEKGVEGFNGQMVPMLVNDTLARFGGDVEQSAYFIKHNLGIGSFEAAEELVKLAKAGDLTKDNFEKLSRRFETDEDRIRKAQVSLIDTFQKVGVAVEPFTRMLLPVAEGMGKLILNLDSLTELVGGTKMSEGFGNFLTLLNAGFGDKEAQGHFAAIGAETARGGAIRAKSNKPFGSSTDRGFVEGMVVGTTYNEAGEGTRKRIEDHFDKIAKRKFAKYGFSKDYVENILKGNNLSEEGGITVPMSGEGKEPASKALKETMEELISVMRESVTLSQEVQHMKGGSLNTPAVSSYDQGVYSAWGNMYVPRNR